jgi:CRISPR system Cascade subunit CasA
MPFLLTTEPWIPCRALDGSHRELGLVDVLVGAHDLEGVHDASPPVTLAVHRLLLAVLHRVFGPSGLTAWKALYTQGSFDEAAIHVYFKAQEARFDLLHPARPFYQVRGLTKFCEPDGVGRLVLERSNYGASVNVFQHRTHAAAAADGLSLPAAARNLLALQNLTTRCRFDRDHPRRGKAGSSRAAHAVDAGSPCRRVRGHTLRTRSGKAVGSCMPP